MIRILTALGCMALPASAQSIEVGDVVPDLAVLTTPSLGGFEYFGEGRPRLSIIIEPNEARHLTVMIEETGVLDDSISGLRTRYVLSDVVGGYEVLEAVREQRCARGDTEGWQTDRCP